MILQMNVLELQLVVSYRSFLISRLLMVCTPLHSQSIHPPLMISNTCRVDRKGHCLCHYVALHRDVFVDSRQPPDIALI